MYIVLSPIAWLELSYTFHHFVLRYYSMLLHFLILLGNRKSALGKREESSSSSNPILYKSVSLSDKERAAAEALSVYSAPDILEPSHSRSKSELTKTPKSKPRSSSKRRSRRGTTDPSNRNSHSSPLSNRESSPGYDRRDSRDFHSSPRSRGSISSRDGESPRGYDSKSSRLYYHGSSDARGTRSDVYDSRRRDPRDDSPEYHTNADNFSSRRHSREFDYHGSRDYDVRRDSREYNSREYDPRRDSRRRDPREYDPRRHSREYDPHRDSREYDSRRDSREYDPRRDIQDYPYHRDSREYDSHLSTRDYDTRHARGHSPEIHDSRRYSPSSSSRSPEMFGSQSSRDFHDRRDSLKQDYPSRQPSKPSLLDRDRSPLEGYSEGRIRKSHSRADGVSRSGSVSGPKSLDIFAAQPIDNYEKVRIIGKEMDPNKLLTLIVGSGRYSRVYMARDMRSGAYRAMKVVNKVGSI